MGINFSRFFSGLNLVPQNTTPPSIDGDVRYNSSTNKVEIYDGAVDSLVTEAGSTTLSNKTLVSATVGASTSNVLSNTLTFEELSSTPSTNPPSGELSVYPKSDGLLYTLNSSGIESPVGTAITVLPIMNGGTGQTTQQAAINALAGAVTAGYYLRGDGANDTMSAIQAADVPTLNQNTTGTASNVTGTVAIANGGTGQVTANAGFNALSPMSTGGDIIYGGASGVATRLPNGSASQVLTSNGGTSAPSWQAVNPTLSVTSQTGNYNVMTSDNVVLCSTNPFTVTLYTAVGNTGKQVMIKKTDSSLTNIISFATQSSQTINGGSASGVTLNTFNESVTLVSDGANWQVLDHTMPSVWTSAGVISITSAGGTNPTKGPTTIDRLLWRRLGNSVQLRYEYLQSNVGSDGTGYYLFGLPSGISIDTTNMTTYANNSLSIFELTDAAPSTAGGSGWFANGSRGVPLTPMAYDSTHLYFQGIWAISGSNLVVSPIQQGNDGGLGTNSQPAFSMVCTVPVSGWWDT